MCFSLPAPKRLSVSGANEFLPFEAQGNLRPGASLRMTERVSRKSMESDEEGSPRARERLASSFWPRETRPYTGTPRVRGKASGMLPLPLRERARVRGCPGMTVKWGKTRCRAASHAANATPRIRRRYHCQPSRTETVCATACPAAPPVRPQCSVPATHRCRKDRGSAGWSEGGCPSRRSPVMPALPPPSCRRPPPTVIPAGG